MKSALILPFQLSDNKLDVPECSLLSEQKRRAVKLRTTDVMAAASEEAVQALRSVFSEGKWALSVIYICTNI